MEFKELEKVFIRLQELKAGDYLSEEGLKILDELKELLKQRNEMLEMLKRSIEEIEHLKNEYKDVGHCGKYLHYAKQLIEEATKID